MKNLETLIQELCPDGVEFVKLGDVCKISRGKVYSKKYLAEHIGEYPVYSSQTANDGILGKIGTYDCDGKFLTWTTDGAYAGTVFYRQGKFSVTNVCGLISCSNPILSLKFLYYWLTIEAPKHVHQGMGNPKLMSNQMAKIEIPLPPIEVQTEIVRILDKFISLEAKLEAELDCRKRQYEYYRDKLLSFDNVGGQEVEWKKMSEVCEIYDGTHQTPKYQSGGIPFISVENIKDIYGSNKYISLEDYESYKIKPKVGDVFMTRIGSIGVCAVFTKQADIAYYVSLALLRPNKEILDSRYLKHFIESAIGRKELGKRILHNAVPIKINKSDIGKVKLLIPSLEEQHRIVSILDRFESLTTSLQSGLPAEIAARRQQYEHYRDKLLTFKPKGAV
ncbi:MAG: restriction endonuclease subunit S [Prevotella copri]|nr:restriction endonuclease subunit S [Segatella copri]